MKIEIQQLAGKIPDEEQLTLLASKQSVERSITDIGALKAQLEEAAKQIEIVCYDRYFSINITSITSYFLRRRKVRNWHPLL